MDNYIYIIIPIGSMYGIFTYIWVIYGVNAGKYSIHGSYGIIIYIYITYTWFPFNCSVEIPKRVSENGLSRNPLVDQKSFPMESYTAWWLSQPSENG